MDGHGAGVPPNGHLLDGSVRFEGEPIIIANEFAEVEVRKVHTRNGVRLEIRSPRAGYVVRLDALELEALSWQSPETFSRLLENPWGP
jgi:hypothetical protein